MKKWLVCLLFVPAMARAEFETGNTLYTKMMDQSIGEKMYVMGVFDVYVNVTFCPGNQTGITAGQIRDMASAWLAANPTQRNRNAEALLNEIFKKAWPCQNRGGGGTRL